MILNLACCFSSPRYRVFRKCSCFLTTPNTCSTFARTEDFACSAFLAAYCPLLLSFFTCEELMLMMLYNTGTRLGLIHAPAHGVLIIKDPGISNGCQFRHSLLTFSGYLRSRFRCAAPGCIQKKKSARLSSTGSFLCGAGHFPTCSLHRFSIIYRML